MKEKFFMIIVVLFLLSCGDLGLQNDDSSSQNYFGSGLYNAPILTGDIVEAPATGVYVSGNDVTSSTLPYVELTPYSSTLINATLSPVAVKQASTFEVASATSENLSVVTSCHTGFSSNNCTSTFTYTPKCSGVVFSQVKLQADKSGAKVINVTGTTDSFSNQCEKNVDDDVVMTISDASHYFKSINEVFYFTVELDKPARNGYKYSANGALNGFYYSYECFNSESNKCNGFVMLLGKIGKYECKGETELVLNIKADYFEGTSKVSFTAKGFGLGKDDNYTCMN